MTPAHASDVSNFELVKERYDQKYKDYEPVEGKSYNIGDRVRISSMKSLFEKGYKHNWSKEIFVVDQVQHTTPTTYLLKDLSGDVVEGAFYAQEVRSTGDNSTTSKCYPAYES
jgi:hypothetical protein